MLNKKLTKSDIYITLMPCLLLIGICVIKNISLVYGFCINITIVVLYFNKIKRTKVRDMLMSMYIGLRECRSLYILILLIGAMVSILLASGVVPAMIYYGFEYLKGMNFLFVAFVIISITSVFMGTAVGTLSTVGIAVLGIGKGFGINPYILLGVVVSGAFIADKISPISGLLNLTLATTNTKYRDALKSMALTLIPTILITGAFYFYLGTKYKIGVHASNILEMQNIIRESFNLSPFLLLVPLLIVILSFLGVKIVYSIISGLLGGILISFFYQHVNLLKIFNEILFGYRASTSSDKLNSILVSGGVYSMLEVLMIVMGAIALSSLLEGVGIIDYVTSGIIKKINTKGDLIIYTGLLSGIMTVVTCDQTIGIILPGRLMKEKYDELNVNRAVLARTISDTGTIIAPLMPWNVNSLIIGLITGLRLYYAPYAVLCFIAPIITLLYGLINKRK